MKDTPPIWALRFLRWFCREDHLEEIEGDLFELFDMKATNKDHSYARRTFLFDVLKFFRWSNFKSPWVMKYSINKGLWSHNFKISLRVLRKNILFSGINVLGLVLGITACSILSLYFVQETSYDQFFPEHDKVYRVAINSVDDGNYQEFAKAPTPLLNLYSELISENAVFSRMLPWPGYLKYQNNHKVKENQFVFADATVFKIFPVRVVHGSLENALDGPFQLVITESKARTYFGSDDPIGKTLSFDEGSGDFEFNVVAVVEDLPYNTHLNFDMIASIKSLDKIASWYNNWFYPRTYLYARFENSIHINAMQKLGQRILEEHANPNYLNDEPEVVFQSLSDIHLSSNRQGEWKSNNIQINVSFFLALGGFILLIAIINYINLTTANSQWRIREIGIKKAMGSGRGQLIKQFFVESFLMISISIMISIALFLLFWKPAISHLLNKVVVLGFILNYQNILLLLAGGLFLALIAGLYPALTTLRFNPVDVIRNTMSKYMGKGVQRKILVTVQFSISMILILFTVLLIKQYVYLQSKDMGFHKDYRIVLKMLDDHDAENYETLKAQLKQLSFVENAAISSTVIGLGEGFHGFNARFPDRPELSKVEWFTLGVDEDYIKTFDIKLVDGRDFSTSFITDERESFILNEVAASQFGGSLIGEAMELTLYTGSRDTRKGKVIGIVEDFHFQSLYEEVKPLIIYINKHPHYTDYLNLKLSADKSMTEQIETITEVYSRFNQEKPMELLFIEDEIAQTYKRELNSSKIIFWFTILSIFIAALGAFGLATYSFRSRTKEIGIRKVLGASSKHITIVLLKEYFVLVAIAGVVSWPLVYHLSSEWLKNFAYAINFGAGNYLLGLLVLLGIILLSNLHQILSSIKLKPVDHLRNE